MLRRVTENLFANRLTACEENHIKLLLKKLPIFFSTPSDNGNVFLREALRYDFFNNFTLQSIEASDLDGKKMLSIDNLNAKIDLISLLKGNIHIESITADNLDACLYTNPDGSLNIQFLIDAFAPKEKRETPNLLFPLITLNNASFRYNNESNSTQLLKNFQFDANNIAVDIL